MSDIDNVKSKNFTIGIMEDGVLDMFIYKYFLFNISNNDKEIETININQDDNDTDFEKYF